MSRNVLIAFLAVVALVVLAVGAAIILLKGSPPRSGKPEVSFATPELWGLGERVSIAAASQAARPANYKVNLAVGGTTGVALPMPTTDGGFVVLTVGSGYYRVNWTDIGGEGILSGADSFMITHVTTIGASVYMDFPGTTQFTFYLLWSDGSQITSVGFVTA